MTKPGNPPKDPGTEGDCLRVSMQYIPNIHDGSYNQQREHLLKIFESVAAKISPLGARVELASLAVSGQNLEAVVPRSQFNLIAKMLNKKKIRVNRGGRANLDRPVSGKSA